MSAAQLYDEKTKHHPRILVLHGGGVNAEVMRLQMRVVSRDLSARFRLVYADGPFLCDAGPGILPVYEGMGPYRRWLRWLPTHADTDPDTARDEIEYQIEQAMRADDATGGDGPWVGLLGFSQGAKLAASILYDQQQREDAAGDGVKVGYPPKYSVHWKFGIILAGRAPLASLSDTTAKETRLVHAADLSEDFDLDGPPVAEEKRLRAPTVHLHGLKDPGLWRHRKMPALYCEPSSVTVHEWDGDHRIPFKPKDVTLLCDAIHKVANDTGVEDPETWGIIG